MMGLVQGRERGPLHELHDRGEVGPAQGEGEPSGEAGRTSVAGMPTRQSMSTLPASAAAATGLLGGFAVGHVTGRRDLAGAVFGLAGIWCLREWARAAGPGTAAALTAGYVAAMGVSHPLAKRTGPWPAVGLVTAAFVAAAEAVARRR